MALLFGDKNNVSGEFFSKEAVTVDLATYLYSACLNTSSDAECVSAYRPPLRHDLLFTLSMTFVYVLLGVFGIFGNALVIIVVSRMLEMRTSANLYLLNLACADLMLVLTGLPLELQEYWFAYPHAGGSTFGPFLCIFRHWASEACAYATVLTICAFTFERACTVHLPALFSSSRSANYRRVSFAVAIIWLLAGSFAAMVSYQWRIDYVISPDGRQLLDSAICIPLEELNSPALFIVPVILFFFVPMGLITLLYLLIWRAIKRMSFLTRYGYLNSEGAGQSSQHSGPTSSHQRVGQMLSNNNNLLGSPVHRPQAGAVTTRGHRCSEQLLLSSQHHNNSVIISNNQRFEEMRQNDRRTSTVIKVQTAVTLTFFVCWAPFHSQRLVVTFGHPEEWTEEQLRLYHIFNAIAGVFYYLEACVNPAIYNLLSQKFRRAFHSTLLAVTNSKNCCQHFKAPHKMLMAHLYRGGGNVRQVHRPGQMATVRQQLLLNVDSAVAANVAPYLMEPGNNNNNTTSPITGPGIANVMIIRAANNINDDSSDLARQNNNQHEMVNLRPGNENETRQRFNSIDKIAKKLCDSSASRQQPPLPGKNLCQFCRHPPRSLSVIPPSSAGNDAEQGDDGDSSSSKKLKPLVASKVALLSNNINNNIVLRRYSDQPSISHTSRQAIRDLIREKSASPQQEMNNNNNTPSSSAFFTGAATFRNNTNSFCNNNNNNRLEVGAEEVCKQKTFSSSSLFVDSNVAMPPSRRSSAALSTSSKNPNDDKKLIRIINNHLENSPVLTLLDERHQTSDR